MNMNQLAYLLAFRAKILTKFYFLCKIVILVRDKKAGIRLPVLITGF